MTADTSKFKSRTEAAEHLIQSIVGLVQAANITDQNLRLIKMKEEEKEIRAALARVLCFHLPEPKEV